jgi:hypothetical protein
VAPSKVASSNLLQAHPLYVDSKHFLCCRTMNLVGSLWFAVWLTAMFAIVLGVVLMHYVWRLDSLPYKA